MIHDAVEVELAELLDSLHDYRDESGHPCVVRNGYPQSQKNSLNASLNNTKISPFY